MGVCRAVSREGRLTGLAAGPYVSFGAIRTYPAGATLPPLAHGLPDYPIRGESTRSRQTRSGGWILYCDSFFLVFVAAVMRLRPDERQGLCCSVVLCSVGLLDDPLPVSDTECE
jgi:hypothetical protein